MLRRTWKPLAATTILVGTPSYLYYTFKNRQQTFDHPVKVRGPDGKSALAFQTFSLLSKAAVDDRLKEHATEKVYPRPNGMTWKYTTAAVAANDPLEDTHANTIISRDPSDPSAPGDLLFFAVMDGHGGPHTSRLLSKTLINAVILELSTLISRKAKNGGVLDSVKSLFNHPPPASVAADPTAVSCAIQSAFTKLDHELLNAPLALLAANLDDAAVKKNAIPDLSQHPMALPTMLPAVSGSCALLAVLDTAHRNLYVACSGDSRAVAGVWEEAPDGKGIWRVETLSEDQTGRNPNELKRIQSEHPADEALDVILAGRVLGGLEPSRAFGDARYKWPREVQAVLNHAFLVGNQKPLRPPPSTFKTPPYVTAKPVVTHHRLSLPPPDDAAPSTSSATLRFIVLATDGLWDELTSQEVVALVGGHFAGLKGDIPKHSLSQLVSTKAGTPTVEGKAKDLTKPEVGLWTFVDDNVSSHLIRNAFGGGDTARLRKLMSIPAPFARNHRDDTTVTVIWWENGREDQAKASTISREVEAKL